MALTQDRTNPIINQHGPGDEVFPVAANGTSFAGGIVALNASGYLSKVTGPGVDNSALKVKGIAHTAFDNTGGANGAQNARIERGIIQGLKNLAGDPVAQVDVGNTVYVEDDETIRKTANAGTRCAAGTLYRINADGTVDVKIV